MAPSLRRVKEMNSIDVVIVGAGQAGLALSHLLVAGGIDHVVLERSAVGERWRSETWDSLTLLTPNWMTRLPGWAYSGPDPDGYMSRDDVIDFLTGYASAFGAPILAGVEVTSARRAGAGYLVRTSRGDWTCRVLVVATGHCEAPRIPDIAGSLRRDILQLHSSQYRSPAQLPPGNVLVVGPSASGAQIADELNSAGRAVTLSTGRHSKLPRTYRGKDIFWWLDAIGALEQPATEIANIASARRQVALQLAGRADRSNVDLGTLQRAGIRLAGRLSTAEGDRVGFAGDLELLVVSAESKYRRLLIEIDGHAYAHGISGEPEPPLPPPLTAGAPEGVSLRREGITSVIWATGFSRPLRWLQVPAFGPDGELAHDGGVTALPGLYAIGYRFLRRRNSSFISGVGADAEALALHIAGHLRYRRHAA